MPQAINITDLNTTLGAYAQENNEEIIMEIAVENDLVQDLTLIEDVIDRIPLPLIATTEMLQPGRKTWNPKNNTIDFSARVLQTRPTKVDLVINPQELFASYLGTIRQKRRVDPTYELLFEQYIMDSIIKQVQKDITVELGWRGVYNPTGTAAKDSFDGFIAILRNAQQNAVIPSSNIAITGTISNTNAVVEFEKVFAKVPGYLMGTELVCYCSYDLFRYYCDDYRSSFGALPYNQQFVKVKADGMNIEFRPQIGMIGTDLIVVTHKTNLFYGMDNSSAMNQIIVEKEKRDLNIMMDFSIGMEFAKGKEIFMNDMTTYGQ
jgi:hypothetical protein